MNEGRPSDAAAPAAGSPTKPLGNVIAINEGLIKDHLDKSVKTTVEETLNAMLDAEADQLCGARRYEHSPDRLDTRAGHYERQLHTKESSTLCSTLAVGFWAELGGFGR
jgi:transposase-like protein